MDKIRLNPNLKVRKESFGCIVLDLSNKEINFYNKGAFDAFVILSEEVSYNDFTSNYKEEDLSYVRSFIEDLKSSGKIENSTGLDNDLYPDFYFSQENQFHETHFASPLAVEIEPTLKCSRNCTYCCYESNPLVNTSNELSVTEWIDILRSLKNDGVFSIKFTGGDPLIKEGFFEILSAADDLGFIITVGSDLTLFNETHAEKLSKLKNLLMVQTTLDGSNPNIADHNRGKGNFKKVIEGLVILRNYNIPFSAVTVVTSQNYNDIYNIGLLLEPYKPLGFDIGMLFDSGRAKEMDKESFPTIEQIKAATLDYSELVNNGIVNSINKAFTFNLEKLNTNQLTDYFLEQNCIQKSPESQLRIDPMGRCYVSITLKEKLQDDLYLGSLTDMSIRSIWNKNETLNNLRSLSTSENHYGKYFYLSELKGVKS
jgi:MoaA/NifB/PqqE/SkfB family radical SAM enzyme